MHDLLPNLDEEILAFLTVYTVHKLYLDIKPILSSRYHFIVTRN